MNIRIIAIASLLIALPVSAQKKKTVVNDSNTPLHLLQPAYQGSLTIARYLSISLAFR